ncbi:hypothetical protein GDO81_023854 [Engystomops pustulosus]|uniref:Uncharacterized protein n=1 Tax=Engystomops pustulosus TaxID=76066 RepID=A0AAV6Z2A4_ENGPU|nr:hypothetical protein GDO81_023854 [Engystomops pustulosus]
MMGVIHCECVFWVPTYPSARFLHGFGMPTAPACELWHSSSGSSYKWAQTHGRRGDISWGSSTKRPLGALRLSLPPDLQGSHLGSAWWQRVGRHLTHT